MLVSLLVIGAHNGKKLKDVITGCANFGHVLLVEPVPYLSSELAKNFEFMNNIIIINRCITPVPGKVKFFVPSREANGVASYGDQLGSLYREHAHTHNSELAKFVTEVELQGCTFSELIGEYEVTSIRNLIIDAEGADVDLIMSFPFSKIMPNNIIFEHKHSDGVLNIGRKLGMLLILLDALGYRTKVLDVENCVAVYRGA